jgi:hypothetical protein
MSSFLEADSQFESITARRYDSEGDVVLLSLKPRRSST